MIQYIDTIHWIVTINPSPNKLINKRRWQLYTNERQKEILERSLTKLTLSNPSISCIERQYERCPSNGQIHLHALYSFSPEWLTTMENWINHTFAWKDDKSKPPWRHLDIRPSINDNLWLEYIRKDTQ